ncbi:MAG: hypothetical protein EOO61_22425 [Hymenobacter sp.]|nr:MAG: hypothetical protein EOO61_22425 [Hymenobacter sp.]
MLKLLTLALLLSAAAFPTLAQTTPSTSSVQGGQYQYCQLIGIGIGSKDAYLEYGQRAKPAITNPELDALNEQIKKMDSVIAGLNYMTNHGWEYLGVSSISPGSVSYVIYTLRRRI